jgi:hypothetical protein
MLKVIVSGVTLFASRFPHWSPAVLHLRWYNQPVPIPIPRVRELRASPTEAERPRGTSSVIVDWARDFAANSASKAVCLIFAASNIGWP